jgi:tRNA pseudouridine38-40 synthase
VLCYDGSDFRGWQVQPGLVTVQGTLSDAIERVTGERVLPQGSGRTDAGVHALAQVASFLLTAPIPAANLHRALNRTLPESIRILSAGHAAADFQARHSARGKIYEYRIYRGEICPPWLARYVYALNWPLDLERMQSAAELVCGRHDFTSFAATDPDLTQRASEQREPDNIREIISSEWRATNPRPCDHCDPCEQWIYRVRGSGFLHHMVRNLVGTFLDVGRGHLALESIPAILAARSRAQAGPTAPARGLFLAEVEY